MGKSDTEKIDFELDLAFHPATDISLVSDIDLRTSIWLTQSEPWMRDMKIWISTLLNNKKTNYPKILGMVSNFSLSLEFTDDQKMIQLNSSWRNQKQTTDVLSFSALDDKFLVPFNGFLELGDIFVSVPTAQRQADEHHHDLVQELRWLVSHGLLHLLGWDHPDEESLHKMLTCQEHLLSIEGMV